MHHMAAMGITSRTGFECIRALCSILSLSAMSSVVLMDEISKSRVKLY